MTDFEFDWQSEKKQTLRGKCWLPEEKPKALLCLIHGFGEHINRYQHLAAYFGKQQIGLIGFDLIGHGKSDGKRGVVRNYETFMQHISEFLLLVEAKFKDVPLFLYGHSMGGNLVATFSINYQPKLQGIIITSPWIQLAKQPPKIQVMMAEIIGSIFPNFTTPAKLNVADLSHDPTVGEKYLADPLVHNRMSGAMFVAIADAGEKVLKSASELPTPLLLMHGSADGITSATASENMAKKNKEIDFVLWENLRHELHNEIEKEKVLGKILSWVEEKSKS